jgi:hypothetical protein
MPVDITASKTEVTASGDNVTVEISSAVTTVEISAAIPEQSVAAGNIAITPTGSITATNLEEAINQLANQQFTQASAPTGVNVGEGDIWYETDTENLYIYREVSSGVFDWRPIIVGATDSDSLDGGLY